MRLLYDGCGTLYETRQHTEHYEVYGPVVIVLTTTSPECFDEETRSRFVQLTMDESVAQTKAILELPRRSFTLEGGLERATPEQVQQLHHNAQRLLRPLAVVNPFVEQLAYPSDRLMHRREQKKYLALINSIALQNLRFIYGIGGKEIAEFDGSSGALRKEYIYGPSGLVATIEPTAVNSNGTRYTTSDHLGSPRVVTNSSASVVSRHDYMPFGDELGSGVGGRTTGMGFGITDGQRQKLTRKERDIETGLDYFGARYFASTQGRFTSVDPIGVKLARMIDPQQLNRYSYVRNNPLKYVDTDGNYLKLAAGLKKADAERIMKDMVKMYRKESGRAAVERMEKSDITFVVGTGRLPDKMNLMAGTLTENYGKTEKVGFTGSIDPKTGKVTDIDRKSGQVNITYDFQKRDDAQSSYDNGLQSKPPDSEQHLFRHEFGHGDDMNNDMVREYNQSNADAEKNAEGLANKVGDEKDTMSEADAEKRVREILDLPPKEEKKKKKNEE